MTRPRLGQGGGGAAGRAVRSLLLRAFASPRRRALRRAAAELRRRATGAPHRVEYFHQADDPYSHLAAQTLALLCDRYEIECVPHLVGAASEAPERELLLGFSRADAGDVAPWHGLAFTDPGAQPPPEAVELAQRILTATTDARAFATRAVEVGHVLWSGDKAALEALAAAHPPADAGAVAARRAAGEQRRARLGHYLGGMFHYGGEWYWGVDRLHHLERRLAALGADREGGAPLFAPPPVDPGGVRAGGRIALDYFPSLRSPYTAIAHERVVDLARRTEVELVLRPVLPMVMRGVPATLAKGRYIFSDAAREAERLDVPFGRICDPIGEPVRRGLSLFPWARERGRAAEYVGSFLRAAFAEGLHTGSDEGLRRVVEGAGLAWSDARGVVDRGDWEEEVEANRQELYGLGLWGVPSFRVRGPGATPDFATWGQDRLFLVAAEIRRRAAG